MLSVILLYVIMLNIIVLNVIMVSLVMLSVIMQNVTMQNAVMPSVILPIVVAPRKGHCCVQSNPQTLIQWIKEVFLEGSAVDGRRTTVDGRRGRRCPKKNFLN
jgi:hypothetical protein